MNEERRPDQVETANTRTTNPAPHLNATVPTAGSDRTVALMTGAFARSWQMLAEGRRDLALIERRRANGDAS